MSHTYGEVLERSYSNIFRYMDVEGATSAILDVGSGYGGILVAAVQQYDRLAYGIGASKLPLRYWKPPPPLHLVSAPATPA